MGYLTPEVNKRFSSSSLRRPRHRFPTHHELFGESTLERVEAKRGSWPCGKNLQSGEHVQT